MANRPRGQYHICVDLRDGRTIDLNYTCPINGTTDVNFPMWYFDNLTSKFKDELELRTKIKKDTKLNADNMYLENSSNRYHPMVFKSDLIEQISLDLIVEGYKSNSKTKDYFSSLDDIRKLLTSTIIDYNDLYPEIPLSNYPYFLRKIIGIMQDTINDPDYDNDHDSAVRDAKDLAYQRIDKYNSFRDTYVCVRHLEYLIKKNHDPNLVTFDTKVDRILNPKPAPERIDGIRDNYLGEESYLLDNSYAIEEEDDYGYHIHI